MENQKFTPGLWEIGIAQMSKSFQGELTKGRLTEGVLGSDGEVMCITGESHANALLIAAAPELLGALESRPIFSKYHTQNGFDYNRYADDLNEWGIKVRAVIKKARGEK